MSLIKLGSISSTVFSNEDPNFYVASVIHSQSGFPYPKLISKVDELNLFYDNDFRYYNMYCDLLSNNIPILLIPVITEGSKYNVGSLRISKSDDEFIFSHPAVNYQYIDDSITGTTIDDLDQYTYGLVFDFSNVTNVNRGDYIILNGDSFDLRDSIDNDTTSADIINNVNFMIWFREEGDELPPLSMTDSKAIINQKVSSISRNTDGTIDTYDLANQIKTKLNSFSSCTAYDIYDILLHERIPDEFVDDALPIGMLRSFIEENPIDFSYDDFYNGSIYQSHPEQYTELEVLSAYGSYLKDESESYLKDLSDYLLSNDYGVLEKSVVVNEVIRIFEEDIFIPSIQSFNNVIDILITEVNNSTIFSKSKNKLLIEYLSEPGKIALMSELDGFKQSIYYYKTQDKLCNFTESNRILEFYSIAKGNVSDDICIEIHKVPNTEHKYYDIIISLGNYQEYYMVDLDKDITDSSTDTEYKSLSVLNESSIVDVFIYDFKVFDENNNVIDRVEQKDYDIVAEYNEAIKTDPDVDINDLWNNHLDKINELPEGKFYLFRSYIETPTYKDEINSFNLIKEYGYHPDLILVDNLDQFSIEKEECQKILDNLLELSKSTYSQVLIELSRDQVDYLINYDKEVHHLTDPTLQLVNQNSRMLYFYGDMTLNEIDYPTYYPYINNIIDANYIKRISHNIIYDEDNGEETDISNVDLDKLNINYLLYNNLYYNYNRLKELDSDPDFILRFNTSKITRIFMDKQSELINCEPTEFNRLVNSLVDKATTLLPLIDNLTYKLDSDNNNRNIELTVQIKSLTNKTFILNINLNL